LRIFEAASAPVDSLRYKTEANDLKKLRSGEFFSREDRNKTEFALISRMEKVKPRKGVAAKG